MKQPVIIKKERRRKTLIIGLGKTGLSCARYLAARGVPWAVTDSREIPPGLDQLRQELPDAGLFLGGFDSEVFAAAERLVVSPGVSVNEPLIREAAAHGIPVLGDIELFCQVAKAPLVAITGSNGKSTVTTLLGEMAETAGLRVRVGGNLGEPALDLLDDAAQLYVLELSSFQLETTHSLRPKTATVLNLSPDHLDRYPDIQTYADIKAKVYSEAEIGVYNRDDPAVMSMVTDLHRNIFYSLGEPGEGDYGLRRSAGKRWIARGGELLLPVSDLLIPGRHNQANALAALALGTALELPMDAMLESLRCFRGLPHRTQFIAKRDGVRWYNDSKGTNPAACIAALEGLHPEKGPARTVLIAGGDGKGADFSPLAPVVARTARAVVLIGRDAKTIEAVLGGAVPVFHAANMKQAVILAAEQARTGDSVLLSPACASFDMYRNYEQRGEIFIELVARLIQ